MSEDSVAEMIDRDEEWREIIMNAEMSIGDYFLSLVDREYDDFFHMIQSIGNDGIKKLVDENHISVKSLSDYWLCNHAKNLEKDCGISVQFSDGYNVLGVIKDALTNYQIHNIVQR